MPYTKTFYVLKHHKVLSYLKSKDRTLTGEVQQALRATTPEEAEGWKKFVAVPFAWNVVPVEYDTGTGRAREPVRAIEIDASQMDDPRY